MSTSGSTPAYGATLGEIMTTLEAAGFTGQLASRPGGMILCFTCRRESEAGAFTLQAQRRTEGASDPDDMLAILGLACPQCGAQGTIVLKYGPESDEEDAEVLSRLGIAGQ